MGNLSGVQSSSSPSLPSCRVLHLQNPPMSPLLLLSSVNYSIITEIQCQNSDFTTITIISISIFRQLHLISREIGIATTDIIGYNRKGGGNKTKNNLKTGKNGFSLHSFPSCSSVFSLRIGVITNASSRNSKRTLSKGAVHEDPVLAPDNVVPRQSLYNPVQASLLTVGSWSSKSKCLSHFNRPVLFKRQFFEKNV